MHLGMLVRERCRAALALRRARGRPLPHAMLRSLTSASTRRSPLVFLCAGESSGDAIGGKLMRALRQEHGGPLRFAGIGGQAMQAEGLQSLFPMEELSVMGFAEVLPRLPRLRARLHQAIASVRELQPRLVLGIDSKAFNLRLLRALADTPGGQQCAHTSHQRPALVQYVAPSAWAHM